MSQFENYEELIVDFLDESFDLISKMEQAILDLEKDKNNRDKINEIFRGAHTIKGSSATLEITKIAEFAHLFEDSLDFIRSNEGIEITSDLVDIILEGIDVLKQMVESVSSNNEYNEDLSDIKSRIESIPSMYEMEGEGNGFVKENPKKSFNIDEFNFDLSEVNIPNYNASMGNLFSVVCVFSEEDPMAGVGPIQAYSSLRDLGLVFNSKPSLEVIKNSNFHKVASFLIATKKNENEIKKFAFIPDTMEDIIIKEFEYIESVNTEPAIQVEEVKKDNSNIDNNNLNNASQNNNKKQEINNYKKKEEQEKKVKKVIKQKTILRVDSTRVDKLLKLVQQLVINKASLLEIMNNFTDLITSGNFTDDKLYKLISEMNLNRGGETAEDFIKEFSDKLTNVSMNYNSLFKDVRFNLDKLKNDLNIHAGIINQLQESVMKIRMVPIEQLYSRFPRIIRDLSRKLSKKVHLETIGGDTELDKSIIEELSDPLMHIVRNAMDHGVETEKERVNKGKDPEGLVKISARNEGNIVYITIEDDGKGIDPAVIREKAIQKNLITPEQTLTKAEILSLILLPGFSTAKEISDVSGRGVGMDVVKQGISNLNGTISIESNINKGSKFIIKLPLTLAIIQALMVNVGDETYAIPVNSIIQTNRISREEVFRVENKEVIKFRDEVISLVFLDKIFNINKDEKSDNIYVVVVSVGETKVGLVVDSMIGELDIVIQPLNNKLTKVEGIAGAAILGNGDISLIIDINQLIENQQNSENKEDSKINNE